MTNHQDSAMAPPIFVVGPPRSGTTLMAKILGRHSRIFMPGETHFFDDVYSRRSELGEIQSAESADRVIERLSTLYGRYNEHPDQARVDLLLHQGEGIEQLRACRGYGEILTRFMELQMRLSGKARWGNNVPKDIFHMEEILSFYPAAKVVVCVRDVRDFLCSYRNKWTTALEENGSRLKDLYHPVLTSLLWRASVRQIARLVDLLPPENLWIVGYERLVQDPAHTVRDICRFIGENFEEGMLNVDQHNSSFAVKQDGIYSSSVGRWRQTLTQEEVCTAQSLTKKYLAKLGYATEKVEVKPLRLAGIWATFPLALARAVRANKAVRGPLCPYIARRISALLR